MALGRSVGLWIVLGVVAAAAIPTYGLFSGHLAEMMGGRMMLWGLACLLIILIELAIALTVFLRAIARRMRQ